MQCTYANRPLIKIITLYEPDRNLWVDLRVEGQVDEGPLMKETMVYAEVTYTLEQAGKFYVIEHVPARVCKETGEQLFAPETVEHIQALIKSNRKPDRVVETPVYEYT